MNRTKRPGQQGGHMAASFTDLMASLMVIFLLLFVAYSNNASASRMSASDRILNDLSVELADTRVKGARVEQDPRDRYAILVVMPDSLLFDRGSAVIRDAGRQYLARFIPRFADILFGAPGDLIESVVVEGHTDTTYAGNSGRAAGAQAQTGRAFNLELSQNRSLAVVKQCLETLRDDQHLSDFLQRVSASGRGQEELLPGFPGDAPQQRRVLFKIRVRVDGMSEVMARVPMTSPVATTR